MSTAGPCEIETQHWLCPPRAGGQPREWSAALARLSSRVQPLTAMYSKAHSAFGLELRTAYVALERAQSLSPADSSYARDKLRILFMRPAVEPIAGSFAARVAKGSLDAEAVLRTASLLAGSAQRFRVTRAGGSSNHGRVEFEPPETARCWLPALVDLADETDSGNDAPVYLYARTIMAHPFSDANGRFARLLFAFALGKQLRLPAACVALAPSFYRLAEQLSLSVSNLSRTGDWLPLTRKLIAIVDDALHLTEIASGIRGETDAGQ